jgi:short subunit dehydrogenase-like uncharacterized protein
MSTRRYELVVYGATGYTGREAVAYLAGRASSLDLGWAIAGRDGHKLAELAASLPEPRPGVLAADASDPGSLATLASSSPAVVSFVGPHAPLGDELLRQCIAAGTHYADLCGENDVIAARLAELDPAARAAGVKLIPACGYESVPFDLGVLGLDRAFHAADGSLLQEVDAEVRFVFHRNPLSFGHGNSGGTLATVARLVEDGELTDTQRFVTALRDASSPGGGLDLSLSAICSPAGDWLAPLMPTPFLNPAIVGLSSARLNEGSAHDLRPPVYREALNVSSSLGNNLLGFVGAKGLAALLRRVAAMSKRRRNLGDRATLVMLKAFAPRSGRGPSRASLDAIDYRIDMRARSTSGVRRDAIVHGAGHPGYRSSANILAEAGIALARNRSLPERHGVLTPATGLGLEFIESLALAGLSFDFGMGKHPSEAEPLGQ